MFIDRLLPLGFRKSSIQSFKHSGKSYFFEELLCNIISVIMVGDLHVCADMLTELLKREREAGIKLPEADVDLYLKVSLGYNSSYFAFSCRH